MGQQVLVTQPSNTPNQNASQGPAPASDAPPHPLCLPQIPPPSPNPPHQTISHLAGRGGCFDQGRVHFAGARLLPHTAGGLSNGSVVFAKTQAAHSLRRHRRNELIKHYRRQATRLGGLLKRRWGSTRQLWRCMIMVLRRTVGPAKERRRNSEGVRGWEADGRRVVGMEDLPGGATSCSKVSRREKRLSFPWCWLWRSRLEVP